MISFQSKIFSIIAFLFAIAGARAEQTERVYLSGMGSDDGVQWEFFCTGGMNSGQWTTIQVPSCWEQQGFGAYTYGVNFYGKATHPDISTEEGHYKHTFHAPEEWNGKKINLVFEGVMTDALVKINGTKAGEVHQGGFYRFGYDITNLLKYGSDNLLEVDVKKESDNASVNLAERRADYWNFGGIFRPVYLEVMPEYSIGRTAIAAGADGSFLAEVYLTTDARSGWEVSARLYDAKGKETGREIMATPKEGSDKVVLRTFFDDIQTWTPETPNLYTVRFDLKENGMVVHQRNERIGFRTIEIREGDGFYINGARVNMRGVNRHSFRPETGRTLSNEQNYEDVRLMKAMNMNTVRLSHYPADPAFLDACDELGLYVLNEIGGWHGRYDSEVGSKLVRETVTRDVNHPSVVFWDNGNEGGWNVELDDDFHLYDPQKRPVLHPQQDLNGVETMHYRSYGETQEYLRGELIFFPTEFLHGLYDGGLGAGLYDYWNMMYPHPRCAGGLLWVLADEGVVRTDLDGKIDNDGNHGADGIVGPHHEKEGSFFTIKEVWSPVYIDMPEWPANFDGTIEVENRYDFTNLKECTFQWELIRYANPGNPELKTIIREGSLKSPSVKPHEKGCIQVPSDWGEANALLLTANDPFGEEIYTWCWSRKKQDALNNPSDEKGATWEFRGYFLKANVGDLELRFDRETGMLLQVHKAGDTLSLSNGPRFVAFRRGDRSPDGWVAEQFGKGDDRKYTDVSGTSRLTNFQARKAGDNVEIWAEYFGPLKNTLWTLTPTGEVRLDYSYEYDGVVELMGIQFDYPEDSMNAIQWLGEGPYRSWQNRVQGTEWGIWENEYNNPVPGETFAYPEFKGFFGNWHWASFRTLEGTIHMATSSNGNYLGVYAPRDGRDAPLYTFPPLGLSVLDVIPAVRNKVNTTDLIGPQSQAQRVSGERKGTIWFRFEKNIKPQQAQ
ncbi:MAG TPA: glycoside hydrolase family 2 TIM barrel-domain containing protein [Prolixibacteraceae bacterium]|nr:glycoside hydrolase family 2 TIM barrel-domain containing protein [Prolixibacteraceae bacterium]